MNVLKYRVAIEYIRGEAKTKVSDHSSYNMVAEGGCCAVYEVIWCR